MSSFGVEGLSLLESSCLLPTGRGEWSPNVSDMTTAQARKQGLPVAKVSIQLGLRFGVGPRITLESGQVSAWGLVQGSVARGSCETLIK